MQQPAGNEEGESWIECRLRIASATDVFAAARAGEAPHGEGAVAGAAEGVAEGDSGGGRRNKLQEVEVRTVAASIIFGVDRVAVFFCRF